MTPPLLLLPGMMCDGRLFAPQIAAFSASRAVQVGALAAGTTMAELAAHVLEAAPARFVLGGLSLGGIVAMEVLRQAPERVLGLALLNTNPLAEAPERRALRGPQIEAVRAGHLDRVMREEMKPLYLASGPRRVDLLDLCMEMAHAAGADVFEHQSLALRDRPDQTATLEGYSRPALVLCGAEDRACPPERHRLMARLMPQTDLVIVREAGHLSTLEQPQAVNEAIARLLSRVG